MLHIGTISEHPEISRMVEQVCGEHMKARGRDCSFYTYENSYVFLQDLDRGRRDFDLLFMDTDMRGLHAVELAERLKEREDSPVMIFLSATPEGYYEDAFRVGAVHFLTIPLEEKALTEGLTRGLSALEHRWHKKLLFRSMNGVASVDLSTLEAVVSDDHHQVLCLSDGTTKEVRTKLSQLEKRLEGISPFRFIISCRGVLVNVETISEITSDRVITKSGRVLPLSKRRSEELVQALTRYHGEDVSDLEG
jgi:DNA-binding LytR/AlgR family response regulator